MGQKELLLNPEVIAVNQDKLAEAGDLVYSHACTADSLSTDKETCQMWAKRLQRGWAVALANFGSDDAKMLLNASLLGVPAKSSMSVRDIWARSDKGTYSAEEYVVSVQPHATKMFVITESANDSLVV